MTTALAALACGLIVTGLALWSVPLALIIAGCIVFGVAVALERAE